MTSRGSYRARSDRGRLTPGVPSRRGPSTFSPQVSVFRPEGARGIAEIDSRLSDRTQEQLINAFNAISVSHDELPLRPGYGTLGKPVKLRSNFFPIRVPKGPLYEYDVLIDPSPGKSKRVKRRIFQLAEISTEWAQAGMRGLVAHDHAAKLISAKELAQPLYIHTRYWEEDEEPTPNDKEYILTLKFQTKIETDGIVQYLQGDAASRGFDPMPIINALNLLLSAHPARPGGGILVGRNRYFFKSAMDPFSLGGSLEAWRGFYSSVRPAHYQLMINVNVCTTAFYVPGNLANSIQAFTQSTFGGNPRAFIEGVRVKTTHLGYKKSIRGMSNHTARQHTFFLEDFGMITVEQYFLRKHKTRLRFPDIALVDLGTGIKSVLIPAELCEVLPDQPYRGKLLDEHTANMIKAATKPPSVNASVIVSQGTESLGFKPNASPQLRSFGITIGNEMTVVPGRVLPPPQIQYSPGSLTPVDDRGAWNLRQVKFFRCVTVESWGVLVIRDGQRDEFSGLGDPQLRATYQGFAETCRSQGIAFDREPKLMEVRLPPKDRSDPVRSAIAATIRNAITTQLEQRPSFILVILSNGDKHVYSAIKYTCDVGLDVHTICVHSSRIRKEKGQPQYYANVSLKLNMKLGGINHTLDDGNMRWLHQKRTMLVGIDVTHPGIGSVKGTPSIAAVVASYDKTFAKYPCSLYTQESKKEMVTNLERMMHERLTVFQTRNSGFLPDRILIYRDGVSEGQFSAVRNEELFAIKQAIKKLDTAEAPYNPAITIVICGKRHHTRFYPTNEQEADRNGNPKAGTVVDRGVTSVYNFDFFLQAHGGLHGTTRPTHYYVVHDENQFTPDALQTLTNAISYMFARATKAVSLVSPAYYADLACERGRCYLNSLLHGIRTSATSSDPERDKELVMEEAINLWGRGVTGKRLIDSMFYL